LQTIETDQQFRGACADLFEWYREGMEKQFIVDKTVPPAKQNASLTCACGRGVYTNVAGAGHHFWFECDNPECRRVYRVEYVGRRRPPARLELAPAPRD
jgi:hypothetical protein